MGGTPAGAPAPPRPALVMATLVKAWRGVVWYLRGVLGADAYQRYLEHHARTHPGHAPLSERAFWKDKMDWEDRNPQGRCC
ncbi:uncharacterized short protein YbdD (DUF466 family) [Georgenia soli]|uniref:Uncharacterized short protein YbdD (DUF466 family) n=2 Tax=Georgenia soli TaxID=638953 RepID=A0A2A9EP17_9MICO|nr:uncharacterized short protein YbdD (DUF466 family) [Georgenia soli]